MSARKLNEELKKRIKKKQEEIHFKRDSILARINNIRAEVIETTNEVGFK